MKPDRKTSYLKAILINLAVLAAFLILYYPVFETNDDMAMANFVNGIAGYSDPHLIFQSTILGKLYELLYGITGKLPWYGCFQYGVLFTAFTAITYVLGNRLSKGNARVILAVLLFVGGYETYANVQFTRTAATATAAGILILLHSVSETKKSHRLPDALIGLALIAVGSMMRFDAFLSVTAMMSGLGVYRLWQFVRREKDPLTGQMYPLAKAFALILIAMTACITLRAVDQAAYSGSQWEYFNRFNDARSELVDYGVPDYQEYQEAYQALGVSANDLQMIKTVNILDPEVFTAEKLEAIAALKADTKQKRSIGELITGFLNNLVKEKMRLPLFIFLVCMTLMVLCSRPGWKSGGLITGFYELLALGGIFFALYVLGRSQLTRVNYGPVLATVLVLAMICEKNAWKQMIAIAAAGLILVKAAGLHELYPQPYPRYWGKYEVEATEIDKRAKAQWVNAIGSDKGHTYLAALGNVSDTYGFSVLDRVPKGLTDNIIYLGGWETETPFTNHRLEANGVTVPLRDVVNSEKLRLVCDEKQLKMFLKFIRQHYDREAQAEKTGDVGTSGIYKIVSD